MFDLSSIGILIHFYRKELKLSLSSFTRNIIDEKPICSIKTLVSIEKGNIHKIEIYDELCKNIGKKLLMDMHLYNEIEEIKHKLIHSIEEMSLSEMKSILKTVYNLAITDKHIYLYECLLLYKDILRYLVYNELPNIHDVQIFNALESNIDEENRKLILYFLYRISNINTMNIDRQYIIDQCAPYLDDPLFFSRKLTSICSTESLFNAYHKYNEIKETQKLNLYQSAYLNYMISYCFLNGNSKKEAYDVLKEEIKRIPANYFPCNLECQFYMGFGVAAHAIEKYDEAVEYFYKVLQIDRLKLNYNYLLYFDSLEKLNRIDVLLDTLSNTNLSNFQNELVQQIFFYYRIKYQDNISEKVKYALLEKSISVDLASILAFGEGYERVLMSELNSIISVTKNYKALYLLMNV